MSSFRDLCRLVLVQEFQGLFGYWKRVRGEISGKEEWWQKWPYRGSQLQRWPTRIKLYRNFRFRTCWWRLRWSKGRQRRWWRSWGWCRIAWAGKICGYGNRCRCWSRDCVKEEVPVMVHVEDASAAGWAVMCSLWFVYMANETVLASGVLESETLS